jgi:hypothetical protein
MEAFSPGELEERHRLLFEMVKIIWKQILQVFPIFTSSFG